MSGARHPSLMHEAWGFLIWLLCVDVVVVSHIKLVGKYHLSRQEIAPSRQDVDQLSLFRGTNLSDPSCTSSERQG